MGYNVSGLTQYVEEHRLPLIGKCILGAKTLKMVNLQTDVKGKTALNLFDQDVEFQNAASCGFSASAETKFTQRMLDPVPLKVNLQWCPKDLLRYWMQYEVKVAAGAQKDLPFEEYIFNQISEKTAAKLEKMYYQGVSGSTTEFEGILSHLATASGSTKNVSVASGTTALEFIKKVANKIPTEVKEKGDAVILVSSHVFEEYIDDLVSANLYHYNPENDGESYKVPGKNVKVIRVNGLNGTATYDYAIGGRLSNLFYGTDGEGDEQKFDFWWSNDDRVWKLDIEFQGASQVAYPEEIAVGKRAQ